MSTTYSGIYSPDGAEAQARAAGIASNFIDQYIDAGSVAERYKDEFEKDPNFVPPEFRVPEKQYAGMDALQQAAIDRANQYTQAGQGIGGYEPYLTQGGDLYSRLASGDQSVINQFMNPYQQQVVDTAMADFDRQAGLAKRNVTDQAIRTGAFGGSRNALAQTETDRNIAQERSRALGNLLFGGYNQAMTDIRNTAQGLGQFGQAKQAAGLTDIGALMDLGGARRNIDQGQFDTNYGNQLNKFYFPYQQALFAMDLQNKVPSGMSSITSSTAPGTNPFLQTAATAANLATSASIFDKQFPGVFGTSK